MIVAEQMRSWGLWWSFFFTLRLICYFRWQRHHLWSGLTKRGYMRPKTSFFNAQPWYTSYIFRAKHMRSEKWPIFGEHVAPLCEPTTYFIIIIHAILLSLSHSFKLSLLTCEHRGESPGYNFVIVLVANLVFWAKVITVKQRKAWKMTTCGESNHDIAKMSYKNKISCFFWKKKSNLTLNWVYYQL